MTDKHDQGDKKVFQAEVKQLLQLVIHSLYSNREIFLRELVSNAADACDKLRFEALEHPELLEQNTDLKIKIKFDKQARTITISDNGIGMSSAEAELHLGTIAKSGTKDFFKQLTGDQQKDANLIGQFGVGFYSAFIVADKVTVHSRKAGLPENEAVEWSCAMSGDEATGEYFVRPIQKEQRGTDIILHLRDDQEELLSGWKLRALIRKYSDHILQPIVMEKEKWDEDKKEQVLTDEEEVVNQANALWTRARTEIQPEEYQSFYKQISLDYQDPLSWIHAKVEGRHEYTYLLYIPSHAPFDLWNREAKHGVRLYVKRVFIMDDAEKLMPNYLRFIRGVIDSADLPLNVSREILQESRDIDALRAGCTKKILGLLEDLANSEEPEKQQQYTQFWQNFGQVLKEGVAEDSANQEKIAGLLRFATTHQDTEEETVSLQMYLDRMKPNQEKIYYITADSFNAAKNSPQLEFFRKKGIEVLLLSNRIDEWLVTHLSQFKDKALQSVAKGGGELDAFEDEQEKAQLDKARTEFKDLLEKMKTTLGDKVKEVKISTRLTDSPACLVTEDQDMSMNLTRMLKMAGQDIPTVKPILEVNPEHIAIQSLKVEDQQFDDWVNLIFDQAVLIDGGSLDDPTSFVKRINKLIWQVDK